MSRYGLFAAYMSQAMASDLSFARKQLWLRSAGNVGRTASNPAALPPKDHAQAAVGWFPSRPKPWGYGLLADGGFVVRISAPRWPTVAPARHAVSRSPPSGRTLNSVVPPANRPLTAEKKLARIIKTLRAMRYG